MGDYSAGELFTYMAGLLMLVLMVVLVVVTISK